MEFEDKFRIIEEAVNMLFDGDDLKEPRQKWAQILHQIRTNRIWPMWVNPVDCPSYNHNNRKRIKRAYYYIAFAVVFFIILVPSVYLTVKKSNEGPTNSITTFNATPINSTTTTNNTLNNFTTTTNTPPTNPTTNSKPSPINTTTIMSFQQRLIFTPPNFNVADLILRRSRFPIGEGFTAANIGGQAIIWGGRQENHPDFGYFFYLLDFMVYSYIPNNESGEWKVLDATGSIHPGICFNAFAVVNSKIIIFGGRDEKGNRYNALSTLSADGHFERLNPEGWIPSPREDHQGFVYNGKFYFIGGVVTQRNELRRVDYIHWYANQYFTNELIEYDPISNTFTQLFTRGARLSPRYRFALAVLEDRVFIHGGFGGSTSEALNDFYVLDMESLELAIIQEKGYQESIVAHVSIPLSETLILFVGGVTGGVTYNTTNEIKIFDAEKSEWKEEEPLSSKLGTGLTNHRAISFPRKDGVSILCLGGFSDPRVHPSYMVLFNVTFN